ncbi:hypothetical protein INR77_15605 [Erythrobacter sp. SCSIO 43205]|uniref:hypothetical protein n=1 Tax=Erythrobacter sp. SCSIO 43205 TaxID=2779361 RepID=UPI001CA8B344|nr:hypothetical protein [Erythrobacter sp. SCSIO 43205]UAB78146.1 hypothetical protein INR77_15605 [Erythrobacter sp. SCSIO 43205]
MIKAFGQRFLTTARDGIAIWWMAPIIPALVVLPEFAQHIAEIQLGMFENEEQAKLASETSTRMSFGYLKIAGLVLAFLATIRFWGARAFGHRWWDLRTIAWLPLLIAVVLIVATSFPGTLASPYIGEEYAGYIDIALALATLPLFPMLVRALAGDRETGLKRVFRTGWFAAIRMVLFAAVFFVPLQWLHGELHSWAIGASVTMVWALMIIDSVVVGLLATYAGTAFHHGSKLLREPVGPNAERA